MINTRTPLQASVFFILCLVASVVLAQNAPLPTSPTYITVNGKPIPKARADLLASTMPSAQKPRDAEAMRRALGDELVRRELAAQEAVKRGLDNRPDVQAQIDMAVQNVLGNAYFSEYLRANPVSDELIKREYESIRSTLGNREYKVRHILLVSAADAQAIIDRLAKGEKFIDLAKQSHDRSSKDIGGDLGWINAATYVKPFSEATAKLQKNAHTLKPVQSEFGWHVIQLDDVRELKVPTLAEVKPQLVQHLQQQIIERHLADLRAKAKIE
jgi:peptidyl-prolyl cis-trans isomerase C